MFGRKALALTALVYPLLCAGFAQAQVAAVERDLDGLGVADNIFVDSEYWGVTVKSAETGLPIVTWKSQAPDDWFGWRLVWLGSGSDMGYPVGVAVAPMTRSASGAVIGEIYGLMGDGSIAWSVPGTATRRTGLSLAAIQDVDCDEFADVLSSWWDPSTNKVGFDLISGQSGKLLRRDFGAMRDVIKAMNAGQQVYICGDLNSNLSATTDDLLAFLAASAANNLPDADINGDGAIGSDDLSIVIADVSSGAQAENFGDGDLSVVAMAIGDCATFSYKCGAYTSRTSVGPYDGLGNCQSCSYYERTCIKLTVCDTGLACCPAIIPYPMSEQTGRVCIFFPGNGTSTPCSTPPPAPVPVIPPGYVPNPARPGELMPTPPPTLQPAPTPKPVPGVPGGAQWPIDGIASD